MEIEVGEYIRTKSGIIGKVKYISEGYKYKTTTGHIARGQEKYIIDNKKQRGYISKPYVIKHSKNIIDLIEEGDYVNGERIAKKFYDYANEEYHLVTKANKHYFLNDIETIVTHEQFKKMEYRV